MIKKLLLYLLLLSPILTQAQLKNGLPSGSRQPQNILFTSGDSLKIYSGNGKYFVPASTTHLHRVADSLGKKVTLHTDSAVGILKSNSQTKIIAVKPQPTSLTYTVTDSVSQSLSNLDNGIRQNANIINTKQSKIIGSDPGVGATAIQASDTSTAAFYKLQLQSNALQSTVLSKLDVSKQSVTVNSVAALRNIANPQPDVIYMVANGNYVSALYYYVTVATHTDNGGTYIRSGNFAGEMDAVRAGAKVSVTLFGAVPDANTTTGVGTDNRPAFQACVNYIMSIGGGTMFIPMGHYYIASGVFFQPPSPYTPFHIEGENVNVKTEMGNLVGTTIQTDSPYDMFFINLDNQGNAWLKTLNSDGVTYTPQTWEGFSIKGIGFAAFNYDPDGTIYHKGVNTGISALRVFRTRGTYENLSATRCNYLIAQPLTDMSGLQTYCDYSQYHHLDINNSHLGGIQVSYGDNSTLDDIMFSAQLSGNIHVIEVYYTSSLQARNIQVSVPNDMYSPRYTPRSSMFELLGSSNATFQGLHLESSYFESLFDVSSSKLITINDMQERFFSANSIKVSNTDYVTINGWRCWDNKQNPYNAITNSSGYTDLTVTNSTYVHVNSGYFVRYNPAQPLENPQVTRTYIDNVDANSKSTYIANVGAYLHTLAKGIIPIGQVSAAYTANPGDFIPVNTSSAPVTINLPLAPADRTVIGIKLVAGSNPITIVAGGTDVFNKPSGSTSATLTLLNQGIQLQYSAGAGIWYIMADDLPLNQLDNRYISQTQSYINPAWITSLPWSKITGTPTTLTGYGITDGVSTSGSYNNPTWLATLNTSRLVASTNIVNDANYTQPYAGAILQLSTITANRIFTFKPSVADGTLLFIYNTNTSAYQWQTNVNYLEADGTSWNYLRTGAYFFLYIGGNWRVLSFWSNTSNKAANGYYVWGKRLITPQGNELVQNDNGDGWFWVHYPSGSTTTPTLTSANVSFTGTNVNSVNRADNGAVIP